MSDPVLLANTLAKMTEVNCQLNKENAAMRKVVAAARKFNDFANQLTDNPSLISAETGVTARERRTAIRQALDELDRRGANVSLHQHSQTARQSANKG